jgi:hypothetical protein
MNVCSLSAVQRRGYQNIKIPQPQEQNGGKHDLPLCVSVNFKRILLYKVNTETESLTPQHDMD